MRPLGGLLIGYVGDKHGRKQALTHSLWLMAVPTTLMGCLPVYETAGGWSIVLLVMGRLVQGISVGGQLPASLVYTVEKRDKNQWGFYGSLPMVAANIGSLSGNLAAALMRQILTEQQLEDWGWRIPFFSGILIAFVACYLKSKPELHTTAGVYDAPDSVVTNPIRQALKPGNRLALLSCSLVPMLWASGFYVSFVWMTVFMEDLIASPMESAFWVNACSMLLGITFMLPVAGSLSDRVGRVPVMTAAGIGLAVLGPIFLILISKGNAFVAFLSQLGLGVLLSLYGGPMCAWLVENFSAEVRLTSASLGYDLAHAMVGGFSPLMATALFHNVGTTAPGLLYAIFGVVSVTGLYINYCCGGGPNLDASDNANVDVSNEKATELPEVS